MGGRTIHGFVGNGGQRFGGGPRLPAWLCPAPSSGGNESSGDAGVGLVVAVMGISMAMRSENIIVVLVSLVLGGAVGGWMHLDDQLKRFGRWMESRLNKQDGFASGFITATLVFCVGPMAVLGALAGGLKGEHE